MASSSSTFTITVSADTVVKEDHERLVMSLEILRDKWVERSKIYAEYVSKGTAAYSIVGLRHLAEVRDLYKQHADMLDVTLKVAQERDG